MLILKALSLGPLHGYGIIQRIRQLSDELLEVEQGSLYPAVYRIEQRGWIRSKWGVTETGRRAKFYTLTKGLSKNNLIISFPRSHAVQWCNSILATRDEASN